MRSKTKPIDRDMPRPYLMPREDASGGLTLEELDAASMFDPLQLASQSSQLDPQHCSMSDTTLWAEGLRTPPHYSEMPASIPLFDLPKVGILPKMSPVTDRENALLNLAPGSPVMCTALPGLGQGWSRSERSSCSGSPMSLGSPAGTTSLALALKVPTAQLHPRCSAAGRSCLGTAMRKRWTPQRMMPKRRKTDNNAFTWPAHLVWRTAGLNSRLEDTN